MSTRVFAVLPSSGYVEMPQDRAGIRIAVVKFRGGHDLVRFLDQRSPDAKTGTLLLLLDLSMPSLSGFEVLEWLRGHQRYGRMPVAVVTGSVNPRDRERAQAAGVDGYFAKVPTERELTGFVSRGLSNEA